MLLNIFTDVYFTAPQWSDYVLLVLSMLFLAFSAFFSSSEVAYFTLSPKNLAEMHESEEKSAKTTIKLLNSPQKLLATIMIGNSVANIAFVILSTTLIYRVFDFELTPVWKFIAPVLFVSVTLLTFGQIIRMLYLS